MSATFPLHREAVIMNFRYIKARESLIPFAVKKADLVAGIKGKAGGTLPDEQAALWNYTFHTEMERLVRKEGIVK